MTAPAETVERLGFDGARRLLGQLRDVMAGGGDAQERLDHVVRMIATSMSAEVCSTYIMRAGDILELFATEGLFPESVHRTRLRVGEGLVGVIAATARPLALADAQGHPAFAYRPETGEEIFHSLMGVPILRAGRVTGVLVVQNRSPRDYGDEEVEVLQTVAMVLAELVAGGELVERDEQHPTDGIAMLPHRLDGIRLHNGLGVGPAVLHNRRIQIRELVAEDPEAELRRLDTALADMRAALDRLFAESELGDGGDHGEVLETYRMFAEDRGWLGRIREAINSGLTAAAAVERVRDDTRARMTQITDPYIRERLSDLEDVANRLQTHLAGDGGPAAFDVPTTDFVLIARSLGPAELLDYDRRYLRAVVLEEGSPSAHVAIIARALDLPTVGRCKGALTQIEAGDLVVVDGDNAEVLIRPGEDLQAAVETRLAARRSRLARYAEIRELPATSLDGVTVGLHMNAGLLFDLPELDAANADGIGLFRTELPFMLRSELPTTEEQTELYRRVVEAAGTRQVVFRTLDIGGDKLLPYMPETVEDNPAMGWRALRISLDRPVLLREQLRAMIHAAAGHPLSVMFPMVAEIAEFMAAKRTLDAELKRSRNRRRTMPTEIRVGAMIEVPALLFQLPALCAVCDFVSIGSNDLVQFLYARDRGNPRLADRYDVLSPPLLRCLSEILISCSAEGVPVSLCGDMAGDPLEAMALVGLGFRSLSMAPSSIGPVKAMLRSLRVEPLRRYLDEICRQPEHSLREKLRNFAQDHGVAL